MRPTCFLFILITLTFPLFGSYFSKPPAGWQCIEQKEQLPANILVLFVGHGSTRFAPTIHVAADPLSQSLEDYLSSAISYHKRNAGTTCKDLGQIKTQLGPARMIGIDSPSIYGDVTLLQAYVAYDEKIYVITGISLKEEFKTFSPLFYETIQTFYLDDLKTTQSFNTEMNRPH